MTEHEQYRRVVVSDDPAALAVRVGSLFLDTVATALAESSATGSLLHIALTGGTSGIALLRSAGSDARRADIDWSRVHFWWGDERFVAADSADRNEGQARRAFLDLIDVPEANIHPMAAADGGGTLDEGAAAYARELARFARSSAAESTPSFDICFLGVGPDAHVASLFPGRGEISVADRTVVAVRDSPKPPPERISLTLPVLNASRRVWLVLGGADKAAALARAAGEADPATAPASAVHGVDETVLFADLAAAGR